MSPVLSAFGYVLLLAIAVVCLILYNDMINKKDQQVAFGSTTGIIIVMKDTNQKDIDELPLDFQSRVALMSRSLLVKHKQICYDDEDKLECVCKWASHVDEWSKE